MPDSSSIAGEGARPGNDVRLQVIIHRLWQISIVILICTGLFHLINLVDQGRWFIGPFFLTPFRVTFIISCLLLTALFIAERRLPRLDRADLLVGAVAAVFIIRGLFHPETISITLNLVITGAGVFYLIKHGIRDRQDVRLVLFAITGAVIVLCLFGLVEYVFKSNPLFERVQIDVIGADQRIEVSDQFYRIRSLVGHPGFAAALLVITFPLVYTVFRRRRLLLVISLLLLCIVIFLSFSRGSWFLTLIVLIPFLFIQGRSWLWPGLKWYGPVVILVIALFSFDYYNREEVSLTLGPGGKADGVELQNREDAPITQGEGGQGVTSLNEYIYVDIDESFSNGEQVPVTVIIRYLDRGNGGIWIDYDPVDESGIETDSKRTNGVGKNDTGYWTSAAFYIEDAVFDGQFDGADFRFINGDDTGAIDKIIVQRGKLKLPSIVVEQWLARSGSFSTRVDLMPFTWEVLKDNPLGVGLFATPGTNHHAVDSLPLTWMMEFGWLGLLLLAGLVALLVSEGIKAVRERQDVAMVLYICLVLVILHGGHLMILYDKPSLVLTAAIGGVYAVIRPWRRGGPLVEEDCNKYAL